MDDCANESRCIALSLVAPYCAIWAIKIIMSQQHPFSSKTIRLAVIASSLLVFFGMLNGCLVVHSLNVKMTADGLVFSNDLIEEGIVENKRFILSSFGMTRLDPCDNPNGCGMWEIILPSTEEGDAAWLKSEDQLSLPIRYGQYYPGMEVREGPIPLTPGRYSASGRVDGTSDGVRFDMSFLLRKEFVLKENAQGLLEVEEVKD